MLAAIGPQMQKYLWWKKYLTVLQMVGHVACRFSFHFLTWCRFARPCVSDPVHHGVRARHPAAIHRMRLSESIRLDNFNARGYVLLPVLQFLPTVLQKEGKYCFGVHVNEYNRLMQHPDV